MLKKTLIAASFVAATSAPAMAGNMAEPVMEPTVVIAETQPTGDRSGIVAWLILAALIAVAANN